jgi:hypothetical protein
VIVADHGEEFGEHGVSRHGYTLYQPAVRIPLIVRAPAIAPARVRDVVSGVDVMPSLLSLCDVSFDGAIEGATFVDLMKGGRGPAREAMSEVRWHAGQEMRALRKADCKYMEDRSAGAPAENVRCKLAVAIPSDTDSPAGILIELAADPATLDAFPEKGGTVRIGSERFVYAKRVQAALEVRERGAGGTAIGAHAAGETIELLTNDRVFDLAADPHEMRDVLHETSACAPEELRDALGRHLGNALAMARKYPVPEQYEPSPGDWERLKKLGYAGDEPGTPPPKGPKKP